MEQLQISFEQYKEKGMETRHRYDLNEIIFDLDSQIKILSSQADKLGEAIISQKYLLTVNYVGVGRFAVAVGQDVAWCLKSRNIKKSSRCMKT